MSDREIMERMAALCFFFSLPFHVSVSFFLRFEPLFTPIPNHLLTLTTIGELTASVEGT